MSTIYRKYRPQTFADITGQQHIVQTITNEIATNKVAHSYLFSGPRGVGKTTIARLLAKAVNCKNRAPGKFEPCNECSACKEITEGRNIDVIEIDAASHTGVDNVRENIIENARFKPTQSAYKVFIIDEVHMLSTSSFNALLKTLEEPPQYVVFILATTELHKILATIVSRCQRFAFQKITFEPMMARLTQICSQENIEVDKSVLERIINKSDGCLRDAESLLGQILSLNLTKITAADVEMILPVSDAGLVVNFAEHAISSNPAQAIKVIADSVENGINLDQFAYDLLEVLRTAMIIQSGQQKVNTDYNEETTKHIRQLSTLMTKEQTVRFIDRTLARKQEIKSAPIPQLPLELLAVEMGVTPQIASSVATVAHTAQIAKTEPKPAANATVAASETVAMSTVAPTIVKPTPSISQTIKTAINTITHSNHEIKTPLEDIKKHWMDVIRQLDTNNHSLTFVLKLCELVSTDGGLLRITTPYSFHQDKVNDKKNKKAVEDCLSKLCNERITIDCSLVKAPSAPAEPTETESVDNLAAEFGGEVVSG